MKKNPDHKTNSAKKIISIAATIRNEGKDGNILSDVNGSYTGLSISGDVPEQDADDL